MKGSYAQVWISDALRAFQEQEDIEKLATFKGIGVMGTIVNIVYSPSADKNRPHVYLVDDGTGVIRVVHFLQAKMAKQNEVYNVAKIVKDSGGKMSNLARKVEDTCVVKTLEIGDTVEVKGVPQVYQGMTEIKAHTVRLVQDLNQEAERMVVVDQLRSAKIYDFL